MVAELDSLARVAVSDLTAAQRGVVEATQVSLGATGRLLVITGAGLSADSGIPTFRGEEGYWRKGGRNYRPEELATAAAFRRDSDLVWPWYLYRRSVCHAAQPNASHRALAALADALGPRMTLLTQNVDGLHLRAGSPGERTYEIHGNIDYARCARGCHPQRWPLPDALRGFGKDEALDAATRALLRCPRCEGLARPHVLWFDETYDELHYRWESSMRAARDAAAVWVVGSSGATNLPNQVAQLVASRGGFVLDVNPDVSPFSVLATKSGGRHLATRASEALPALSSALVAALASAP